MNLDLLVYGEVRGKITDYLNNILYDFPDKILGRVSTLAAEHLFKVREDTYRKLLD